MPKRRIQIPAAITLIDPDTGAASKDPHARLDFRAFLLRLFANPLWNESYRAMVAQAAILNAFDACTSSHIELAEEDWYYLEQAAKLPRTASVTSGGLHVVPGIGFTPAVAGQLVSLFQAVLQAEQLLG